MCQNEINFILNPTKKQDYLVPRQDEGAAEDEGKANGEVCGPDNQAQ